MRYLYSFILLLILTISSLQAQARIEDIIQLDPGGSFGDIRTDSVDNPALYTLLAPGSKNYGLYSVGESLYLNGANSAAADRFGRITPVIEGVSGNYIPVYLDGVELNFNGDNSYDASFLPLFSGFKFRLNSFDDMREGHFNSLGKSLTIIQDKPQKFKIEGNAFGGNNYGAFNLRNAGAVNFVYWNAIVAYSSSDGYEVAADSKDSYNLNNFTRTNSNSENWFFMGKGGIRDVTSDFSFSYLTQKATRAVPPMVDSVDTGFAGLRNISTNIFNCLFTMDLNSDLKIKGNFYYKQNKLDADSSDDVVKLKNGDGIKFRAYDGFSFGGNFSGIITWSIDSPLEFSMNYIRNSLSVYEPQTNFYLRNEAEMFSVGVNQKFVIGKDILLRGWLRYSQIIPVIKPGTMFSRDFSEPEFGFKSSFLMTEKFILRLNLSRASRFMPLLSEMQALVHPDTNVTLYNVSNSAEINFSWIIANWFTLDGKVFYNGLDTRLYYKALQDNEDVTLKNDLSGASVGYRMQTGRITTEAQFGILNISGVLYSPNTVSLPGKYANLSLQYDAAWGTGIVANFLWNGDRTASFADENTSTVQDYSIINCGVYQKIYDKYIVYLRANNILNTAYDYLPGYPGLGINFTAGVRIGI